MAINKVVYGDQTLVDLTSDTATAEDVAQGKTFHDASGQLRTGSNAGGVVDVEVNGTSVVDPTTKIAEVTSYEEVTESEYEAIPVAERESNGIAYFIKDLNNPSVQGYPPLIYSDEEREIGVWRDGKPLYQRVFDLGSDITIYPDSLTDTTIDASQMQTLVDALGIYSLGTTKYSVMANINNNVIRLQTDRNNASALVRYVVLRYTKTTDVAGSGIWNGQGGIAHHYSTSETVIGTWIDGKPLYQRVVEFPNSVTVTNQWVDTNVTIADGGIVVYSCGIYASTNSIPWVSSKITSNKLYVTTTTNATINKLILQYTKTTD